jgi:hypothetical protein
MRSLARCSVFGVVAVALALAMTMVIVADAQAQSAPPKDATSQTCKCERAAVKSGDGATAFVVQQPAPGPEPDSPTRLKDIVPLLQSMVWALLLASIAFGLRKELAALLRDRHLKFEAAGVSVEVLAPEQVTDPAELEVRFG